MADRAARESALQVAEAAAREAGAILLERFGHLDRARIRTKSAARDLVTAADVESERAIVARLRQAFPDDAIEAEEEVQDAGDAAGGAPRSRWFIDPLDGTVNFVHGIPAFAVSIARYGGPRSDLAPDPGADLAPEVAVVHVPRLGETFTAERGKGARLDGEPIRVSETMLLGEAILATGFPYRRNELAHNNLENFGRFFLDVRGMRRMGSAAMDLAFVAAGRFDGFWELHLSPHDVAAGALLVREAGGVVQDADGGEDWLRGGHIVASNPLLFETIRARVRH